MPHGTWRECDDEEQSPQCGCLLRPDLCHHLPSVLVWTLPRRIGLRDHSRPDTVCLYRHVPHSSSHLYAGTGITVGSYAFFDRLQEERHPHQLHLGECILASDHANPAGHVTGRRPCIPVGHISSSPSTSTYPRLVSFVRVRRVVDWRNRILPYSPGVPIRKSDGPSEEIHDSIDSRSVIWHIQLCFSDGRLQMGRHSFLRSPVHHRIPQVEKLDRNSSCLCSCGIWGMVRGSFDLGNGSLHGGHSRSNYSEHDFSGNLDFLELQVRKGESSCPAAFIVQQTIQATLFISRDLTSFLHLHLDLLTVDWLLLSLNLRFQLPHANIRRRIRDICLMAVRRWFRDIILEGLTKKYTWNDQPTNTNLQMSS